MSKIMNAAKKLKEICEHLDCDKCPFIAEDIKTDKRQCLLATHIPACWDFETVERDDD